MTTESNNCAGVDAGWRILFVLERAWPGTTQRIRSAGMQALRKTAVAFWIFTLLVSGCTSPIKLRETQMIQIACYKDSDEALAMVTLRDLHEHGILFGGTGGGGYMCICVYPSEANQARKILWGALSRLSPEQRQHSLKVYDQ